MGTLPSRIGNFDVIRQIGAGGMGTVYLGRDPELDRQVAIKVIRDQVHDEEVLERFFREARAAAALRHPNIITIYASGQHEHQPFMAMEFVEGEALADIIRQRRSVPLYDKLAYLEQICSGLQFAHKAGIVHRDIKPANLMVDREGVIRILDFGIARVQGSGMTQDGAMLGSLNYMSPEQMLGRPVDHRSDIFAVGAVAYELLSYAQAFKGGLNDGLLQRLPHEDPPSLQEIAEDVSPALERVVMRALEKAPDRRFPDLGEMRQALLDVQRRIDSEAEQETILLQGRSPRPAGSRGRTPSHLGTNESELGVSVLRGTEQFGESMTRRSMPMPASSGTGMWTDAQVPLGPVVEAQAPVATRPTPIPDSRPPVTQNRPAATQVRQPGPHVRSATTAVRPQPAKPAGRTRIVVGLAAAALIIGVAVAVPWPMSGSTDSSEPAAAGSGTTAGNTPAPASGGTPGPAGSSTESAPGGPAGNGPMTVQDLRARVKALYGAGNLAGALDLIVRNPAAATDQGVGDMAVQIAAASFDAMASAERIAIERNARQLARDKVRDGGQAKARAETARQRGAYVEAATQALAARAAYQQAAADAVAAEKSTR